MRFILLAFYYPFRCGFNLKEWSANISAHSFYNVDNNIVWRRQQFHRIMKDSASQACCRVSNCLFPRNFKQKSRRNGLY